MSYLLSDLWTRTQAKLDDTSFDTGLLTDFANDTEREIFNRYRINIQEQQINTITTTAASRTLTGLPGTAGAGSVGQYISLSILLPINYARTIPYMEYEDVDVIYPNYMLLGQGTPIGWFIFDGTPSLVNNADKTYTLSAKYTMLPTALANATDVPNIPVEFSEITVLGMYARALEFNDEYDEAQAIRQQYLKLATDYVDATRRQAGTPHIMRRMRTNDRSIGQR